MIEEKVGNGLEHIGTGHKFLFFVTVMMTDLQFSMLISYIVFYN